MSGHRCTLYVLTVNTEDVRLPHLVVLLGVTAVVPGVQQADVVQVQRAVREQPDRVGTAQSGQVPAGAETRGGGAGQVRAGRGGAGRGGGRRQVDIDPITSSSSPRQTRSW